MPAAKPKIKIKCKHCGKEFFVNPYRKDTAQCCSRHCNSSYIGRVRYSNKSLNCECDICGKNFHRANGILNKNKHNFCSQLCRYRGKGKFSQGENHPKWNGGIRTAILKRYKKSVENSKLVFNLTDREFFSLWQQPCVYCGSEIKTIGLDRVDNGIGYELGNVVPCCNICNKMKRDMDVNDFARHIKKIYDYGIKFKPETTSY